MRKLWKGVLVGDSDANPGDVLSVSAVLGSTANVGHAVNGAFGVLTLNTDGSYVYNNTNPSAVTAAGGVTEDLFNYTVSNGHGGTTDATLARFDHKSQRHLSDRSRRQRA